MLIEDISRFYRQNKENHTEILQRLKRRIYHVGTLRLLSIVGMGVALWLLRDKSLLVLVAVTCVCLFCFLLLVVHHTKLHNKRAFEEGIIRLFENELKGLDGDFSVFDGAPEQIDAQHAFSMDLDLFGERSLFQLINRTVTKMGKETLIERFKQPLVDKEDILLHQEGVREMGGLCDFRHRFYVTGEMTSKENKDIKFLFSGENNERKISDDRILGVMMWLIPVIWVLLVTGCFLNIVPIIFLGFYLVVTFFLVNLPAKRILKQYMSVSKTEKILNTWSELMKQVEGAHFHADILHACQQHFYRKPKNDSRDVNSGTLTENDNGRLPTHKNTASFAVKKLSRNIGALDQRFSFMGILLNLLYMRDTRLAIRLEKWEAEYAGQLKVWFDTLGFFDAFCSFGVFAFNHPEYAYPVLTDTYFEMEGKALGHPLIDRDKCVRNDLSIPKSKYFLIITGANMAGKSTFLRTVGVNFLFACMGLPVYAESLAVYPARLVTSLRTADSLVSNESYFFAELKRLKMIIDLLDDGEQLLIILDEILKGTNSVDKQKGSIALVKQLIHKNTCGIIATHDLLLGSLADTFPDHVQNKRFEAEITGDELTFTYRLNDGIAQNMNATFLMKKMGIFEKE